MTESNFRLNDFQRILGLPQFNGLFLHRRAHAQPFLDFD
jgi:hypothetical protein